MPGSDLPNVTVVRHPLVQDTLTRARDRATTMEEFRRLVARLSQMLAYELTGDFCAEPCDVEAPLGSGPGSVLTRPIILVPILRAGLVMADGVRELLPGAALGHLGIYRDFETHKPVVYYSKLPPGIAEADVVVLDPMLATGTSLGEAVDIVRNAGAERVTVLCLVVTPDGVRALHQRHPGTPIVAAAVDERLDHRGMVVPGLGDVADRLFGTD